MPTNVTPHIYSSEYADATLSSESADGTYVLKATASSGTITYAWMLEV